MGAMGNMMFTPQWTVTAVANILPDPVPITVDDRLVFIASWLFVTHIIDLLATTM